MGHARKIEDLLETAGRTAAGSAQALRGALEFTGRVAAAALSGIARPQPLKEYLDSRYHCVQHIQYQDHHRYTVSEIAQLRHRVEEHSDKPRVVFTTEKDWMRLQAEELQKDVSLLPVFIVPIEVDFLTENEKVEFNHIIEDYVRRDQTTHP